VFREMLPGITVISRKQKAEGGPQNTEPTREYVPLILQIKVIKYKGLSVNKSLHYK